MTCLVPVSSLNSISELYLSSFASIQSITNDSYISFEEHVQLWGLVNVCFNFSECQRISFVLSTVECFNVSFKGYIHFYCGQESKMNATFSSIINVSLSQFYFLKNSTDSHFDWANKVFSYLSGNAMRATINGVRAKKFRWYSNLLSQNLSRQFFFSRSTTSNFSFHNNGHNLFVFDKNISPQSRRHMMILNEYLYIIYILGTLFTICLMILLANYFLKKKRNIKVYHDVESCEIIDISACNDQKDQESTTNLDIKLHSSSFVKIPNGLILCLDNYYYIDYFILYAHRSWTD
jgi:hypothetical protein